MEGMEWKFISSWRRLKADVERRRSGIAWFDLAGDLMAGRIRPEWSVAGGSKS